MRNKMLCAAVAVVLWLAVAGPVSAQDPYQGCLGFFWDAGSEAEAAGTATNQCVMESRQSGVVFDMVTDTVPDCVPSLTPPAEPWQCGATLCFALDVPRGESEIRVRCVWIGDGAVLAYLQLDPPTQRDADYFWLFDTVSRPYMYLPVVLKKVATP